MKDSSREDVRLIIGLCAVVASSLLVEVCLTKFVSYKVYHHYVYAIISTVILSSGLAGIATRLLPRQLGIEHKDSWTLMSRSALLYALLLLLVTVLFCWLPLDPYWRPDIPRLGLVPWGLFAYFFLFAIPFFFAGLVVSNALAVSRLPVTTIYAFDLAAAAAGALFCPLSLETFGGYGTIVLAGLLAVVAFISFAGNSSQRQPLLAGCGAFAVAAFLLLAYPQWAMQHYGWDIRTYKETSYYPLIEKTFHGYSRTYWSPIARIDVTNTGLTHDIDYVPGNRPYKFALKARFIMVDASAPTRQVQVDGDVRQEPNLGNLLWACPYIAAPGAKQSLVIGAGGGIDLLIAKHFGVRRVDGIEVNPATYKHCLLGQGDPEAALYQPPLQSTAETEVVVHNSEARHFCSTLPPESEDIIHATGVDTITAAASGALTMVENYLYTSDAVKDYMRVLKPDGVLSLTHWRDGNGFTSKRMLLTYLDYLDSVHPGEAWKYIIVVGNVKWTDALMKKSPWTEAEVANVRRWCADNNYIVMVDPFRTQPLVPGMIASEQFYTDAVRSSPGQRSRLADALSYDVIPVSDDKPFFYRISKTENFSDTFRGSGAPVIFLIIVGVACLILFLLPLHVLQRRNSADALPLLSYAGCFAVGGFAFLLYEVSVMQMFSVFVGGPLYSLCVTLVSLMVGYACGSFIAPRFGATSRTFAVAGVVLLLLFCLLHMFLPGAIHAMMPLSDPLRIAISAVIVLLVSFVTGVTPALALNQVKESYGDAVSWMWGVSCAANAIGALSFPLIAQQTGISNLLLIIGALYLVANIGFAALCLKLNAKLQPVTQG